VGKRSGVPDSEADVEKMTLDEINKEIERCTVGAYSGGGQGPKGFFKRLIWMEKMREKLHGIPATRRVWRAR